MSEQPLAKLRFLSWASRGAIRLIHDPENNGNTDKPGQFNVEFDLLNDNNKVNKEKPLTVPIQLYGPENITGIDKRQVIRTFPPHLSSDNESNYFAFIEFDSSFLGWIASLKQATKQTQEESILEPSFVLAVVSRDKQGINLTIDPESKLQVLEFDGDNAKASQELPIIEEAHYWTHIQTLTTTSEESKEFDRESPEDIAMMKNTLKRDDINTICRIISPRRLKPGTSYYGCLLSIYKATNKIIDPNISLSDTNKLEYAWDNNNTSSGKFLVFYSFEFTTDPEPGDFKTLVNRLKPRPMPPKVGTRFMAVPPLPVNYPCYGQTTSILPPIQETIPTLEDDNASNQILFVGQRVTLNNEIIKNTVKVRLKKSIVSLEEEGGDAYEEGSLTLQIIRPLGKPDLVEDFKKYGDWESNDTSIVVNTSDESLKFDVKQDSPNDVCSYDLGEAASNNKWILRFQLILDDVTNDSRLLIGLADNDFSLGADIAQNFLGMQLTQTSAINGILPIYAENFPPQQEEGRRVEYFDDFALSSGQIFHLEISRLSSTSFVIKRYADPNYKQVIESLERSCPGSLQNLKFIKLMNFVKDEAGILQGKIKHLRFWNNLNEINPEGEVITESSDTIATSDISSEFDDYHFDLDDDIKYPPIHGDVIVAIKMSEQSGAKIKIAKYNNKDIRGIATRFEDGEWIDYPNNFDHGFEISYSLEGLGLEGALRSPDTTSTRWPDAEDSRYQDRLKAILNENNESLSVFSNMEPKVLPPLYGSRQAAKNEISENTYPWFSSLNLDPRNRAIAGLGTLVVNDQQEQLREAAWQMIDEIEDINQTLRQGQLSRSVSFGLNQWIKDLSLDSFMMVTNSVHNKILDKDNKITMQNKIKSKLGNGILSPTFRKITNPTGPIGKKIFGDDYDSLSATDDESLTYKINNPDLLNWADNKRYDAGEVVRYDGKFYRAIVKNEGPNYPPGSSPPGFWIKIKDPDFLPFSPDYKGMGGMISVSDLEQYIDSNAPSEAANIIDNLKNALIPDRTSDFDNTSIGNVNCELLSSLNVDVYEPGGVTYPGGVIISPNTIVNFCKSIKIHQREIHKQLVKTIPPSPLSPLDLEEIRQTIEGELNPEHTIPKRILSRIDIGDAEWKSKDPLEQMTVCIEFPQPMWEPLANISQDLLIPGIEHTPQNTISLLEENPSFIESYMVGLNNAFTSEALWHKIPVSLTCSFFRQFWDKSAYPLSDEKELEEEAKNDHGITDPKEIENYVKQRISEEIENRKDIDHIHKWVYKQLGENYKKPENSRDTDNRRVILLIRGELLRKYPNAIIYAVKGKDDNGGEINFPSQTDDLELPKFRIFLKPDITLFGFDLFETEVREKPGYFFVIQEQPSELSFKLDESTWEDFEKDIGPFNYLSIKTTRNTVMSTDYTELSDDKKNKWDSNSAHVADNLLKYPIRVAIHASQMLEGIK